ncbi:N-acetylgalactosamine-N,N'-diacetylbacillosaminyl-diphospho-undecaprenol 4-alpha-N-acetylgalactosaminyltransferase [Arenibacter antarcticus]|uniref:Glycosyltransferase n=1 Tax=Arenibacter antarcticus TaxID=2040469 RepID=A0ABW5VGY2_9FLAO|nr:glycosyltransferase [Arenibacter sp. H213]MCM4167336.1 glycosyltransferase [Arenibacter sp. H213]
MKKSKTKIAFILPSLSAGGAERILSFLAQNVNKDYFDSQLLVIGHDTDTAYCTKGTKTSFLNKKRVLFGIPSIFLFLKTNKPDLVLSSIGHLNTVFGLMAPFFQNSKFIIREASVISEMGKFSNSSKLYGFLAKIAYNHIDAVVCQSEDMAIDFKKIYNIPKNKITVINNPITELFPLKEKNSDDDVIKYITVGRLSKEKGHDRLLNILAKLPHSFHYTIVGSGPEENEIKKTIVALALTKFITHIPFTNEIGKVLSKNDLFLQGSYVEGFPNAVLESCVVGTPVIAFNAPGGTKEIIRDGINGYLVSNTEEFTSRLLSFNKDKWEPKTVRDTVIQKFNTQEILKQYENLFLSLIKN